MPTRTGLMMGTVVQLLLQPLQAISLGQGGQTHCLHGQGLGTHPGNGGVQSLLIPPMELIALLSSESLGNIRLMARRMIAPCCPCCVHARGPRARRGACVSRRTVLLRAGHQNFRRGLDALALRSIHGILMKAVKEINSGIIRLECRHLYRRGLKV